MKPPTFPTFAELLARPARRLHYPDYEILDELKGHLPGESKGNFEVWRVTGHAQIFRREFLPLSSMDTAIAALRSDADHAVVHGVGHVGSLFPALDRRFDGIIRLRQRFGPIPNNRFRLAILRPLEVQFVPAWEPTATEIQIAAENGFECFGSPEHFELLIEFGLDITPEGE